MTTSPQRYVDNRRRVRGRTPMVVENRPSDGRISTTMKINTRSGVSVERVAAGQRRSSSATSAPQVVQAGFFQSNLEEPGFSFMGCALHALCCPATEQHQSSLADVVVAQDSVEPSAGPTAPAETAARSHMGRDQLRRASLPALCRGRPCGRPASPAFR